jgi:hypothetical protein
VTVASPKKCGENPITVQPTKFADEVTAGKKLYYKVGRMSCASGGYVQTTSLLMKYKKHWYRLQNQIDFGDMSTNGDSGSLIVRASDGAITGLVTGLDDGHTIANPVYRHPGFHGAQLVEAPGSDRVKVALFEHDPVVTSSVVPGPELILPPEMPSALVQEALVIAKSEGEEIEGVVKQIRGPWIGLQVADRARLVWIYAADAEWSSVKEGLKKRPDQLPTRDLMR